MKETMKTKQHRHSKGKCCERLQVIPHTQSIVWLQIFVFHVLNIFASNGFYFIPLSNVHIIHKHILSQFITNKRQVTQVKRIHELLDYSTKFSTNNSLKSSW